MKQPIFKITSLIVQIQEIQCDSKIGKSRHFFAADRKAQYQKFLGISVIVIGIVIGSTVVNLIVIETARNIAFAFLGLLSAGLSAFQTFFSFSKDIENHRRTGNLYLDIARDCDNLLSQHNDGLVDSKQCQEMFNSLLSEYKNVTRKEEVCPTSDGDFNRAHKRNLKSKERIRKLKDEILYNSKSPEE